MARGSHWWNEPPWWAWAVVIVGVVLLAVGLPAVLGRGDLSQVEVDRLTAESTAQATASASPESARRMLVIGDSYTGGSDEGGNGANNWTRLTATRLEESGIEVVIDVSAAGGSGYVQVGPTGKTFVDLADQAEGGYDLIVVFGSRNDVAPGEAVSAAAGEAYAALAESSPGAELLVIGPPWVDANPPVNVQASSQAVEDAAAAAGATFVDPLEAGWFTGEAQSLIGGDGVHPTDAGHRYMAELIEPLLRQALESAEG